ncbi:cytochrome C peroxidase [Chitinophaga sp. ysch24]|uniref:Cytochrome C peroxidase n=1 Tax=Chitinophaga tropicalis TaxID=2683588 RepID=A0A7K1U469_9BACT|nr:cytochrome C peroxidase [Chitinophaga tropicalis]
MRQELIRVMTLYISGYDAPLLKTGIREAAAAMRAIDTLMVGDSLHYYMKQGIAFLDAGADFDSFDRLHFLTEYALPLQRLMGDTRLFSRSFLDRQAFPGSNNTDTQLGRILFAEKLLSGNGSRSCASCHQPSAFFTDGAIRNTVLDSDSLLPRHTPGLLYSCYQYSQFWDGRAHNVDDQVMAVLHSRQEMNAIDDSILARLQHKYRQPFSIPQVTGALAAYLRTLAPFSSPFDRYIEGDRRAMTPQQQKGFNVFMGKAQCGTCHFAPVFNGLIPPLYNRTEFEVLGTPANEDFRRPATDADRGRAAFFPIEFYEGAFKTPTARNTSVTAPYMHNGAFSSIDKVIDFYDKGGGAGLGMTVHNQTLSAVPLGLSEDEKKALIAFMEALTDKL